MTISCSPSLHLRPFSEDNVEVAKSIVARLYYAEEAREKRRREEEAGQVPSSSTSEAVNDSNQPSRYASLFID